MESLGLCILAVLSLGACTTGVSNNSVLNKPNQTHKVVTQYPVETAILNVYTRAYSDQLYTLIDGQLVVIDTKVTPKGAMVFNNQQVQGAEMVAITTVNGQVVDKSVGINYFTLEPLVFHGFTSDVGEYSIATQTKPIPKIASIDDSSTYITEQVYSDSRKRKKIKTYTQTWSLKRESNNTAWLCIESSENLLLSYDPEGTSTECYKINAQGDILDSNVTINSIEANGTEMILFNSI